MKPTHYHCDFWKQSFWFCIGWSPEDVTAYLKKNYNHNPDLSQKAGTLFEVPQKSGAIVYLIWTRKKHAGLVAHECVHAANTLLLSRGWKPELDNDEPQAYLVEALVSHALELKII